MNDEALGIMMVKMIIDKTFGLKRGKHERDKQI